MLAPPATDTKQINIYKHNALTICHTLISAQFHRLNSEEGEFYACQSKPCMHPTKKIACTVTIVSMKFSENSTHFDCDTSWNVRIIQSVCWQLKQLVYMCNWTFTVNNTVDELIKSGYRADPVKECRFLLDEEEVNMICSFFERFLFPHEKFLINLKSFNGKFCWMIRVNSAFQFRQEFGEFSFLLIWNHLNSCKSPFRREKGTEKLEGTKSSTRDERTERVKGE